MSGTVAGSRPGGRPHFLYGQEMGKRSRRGLRPLDPQAATACGHKGRGPVPRIEGPAYSSPSAAAPRAQRLCRRASGAVPRVRPGRPIVMLPKCRSVCQGVGARALLQRPSGTVPDMRTGRYGRWVRPQPELSPQLVYLWGVTATGGYWQGTPGGFSRGLAEVPLSVFLPPTSWACKKSARLPGRVPAIYAAEGGSSQPSEGGR